MSEYLVNSQDLVSVANAIRTKGETQAPLTFPNGFISAVNNISTGIPTSLLDNNGTRNNFSYLFYSCSNLKELPALDFSSGTNFSYFLDGCFQIKTATIRTRYYTGLNFNHCFNGVLGLTEVTLSAISIGTATNMFYNCGNLVTINGMLNFTANASLLRAFSLCRSLENITLGSVSTDISFSSSPLLTTNSLLSIANALNSSVTGRTITLHTTSKTNCDNILGYNNGGTFELSGSGTQMSLTDFILNIKGWSIA